jgi:hypothetical protein
MTLAARCDLCGRPLDGRLFAGGLVLDTDATLTVNFGALVDKRVMHFCGPHDDEAGCIDRFLGTSSAWSGGSSRPARVR